MGNEQRPGVHQSLRVFEGEGGHSPGEPGRIRGVSDSPDCLCEFRLVRVALDAQCDRQVAGSDEEDVDSRDGGDFVHGFQRFARLDLNSEHPAFLCPFDVFADRQ